MSSPDAKDNQAPTDSSIFPFRSYALELCGLKEANLTDEERTWYQNFRTCAEHIVELLEIDVPDLVPKIFGLSLIQRAYLREPNVDWPFFLSNEKSGELTDFRAEIHKQEILGNNSTELADSTGTFLDSQVDGTRSVSTANQLYREALLLSKGDGEDNSNIANILVGSQEPLIIVGLYTLARSYATSKLLGKPSYNSLQELAKVSAVFEMMDTIPTHIMWEELNGNDEIVRNSIKQRQAKARLQTLFEDYGLFSSNPRLYHMFNNLLNQAAEVQTEGELSPIDPDLPIQSYGWRMHAAEGSNMPGLVQEGDMFESNSKSIISILHKVLRKNPELFAEFKDLIEQSEYCQVLLRIIQRQVSDLDQPQYRPLIALMLEHMIGTEKNKSRKFMEKLQDKALKLTDIYRARVYLPIGEIAKRVFASKDDYVIQLWYTDLSGKRKKHELRKQDVLKGFGERQENLKKAIEQELYPTYNTGQRNDLYMSISFNPQIVSMSGKSLTAELQMIPREFLISSWDSRGTYVRAK